MDLTLLAPLLDRLKRVAVAPAHASRDISLALLLASAIFAFTSRVLQVDIASGAELLGLCQYLLAALCGVHDTQLNRCQLVSALQVNDLRLEVPLALIKLTLSAVMLRVILIAAIASVFGKSCLINLAQIRHACHLWV